MNQITANIERSSKEWTVWKRRAVFGFVVLSVLLGFAVAFISTESPAYTAVQVVASLVLVFLYVLWCFADSLEGGYPVGRLLTWLILLAPYVGIPAYVIRCRGLAKGGTMLGKILGFVLLMVVLFRITKEAVVYLLSNHL